MTADFKGHCPRCEQELCAGELNGMELDMCASCYGILLEQSRLVGLLEVMAESLKDSLDPDLPLEVVPDRGGAVACPRCHTTMAQYGYMDTKWVTIESCRSCSVLWLDTDELGMIALLYTRSKVRADKIRGSRPEVRSLAPRLRSNQLGNTVRSMFAGDFC